MLPEPVSQAFSRCGIPAYGVCRLSDVLPLLDCRAAQRVPRNAQSVLTALFPYRLPAYSSGRNLSKYAVVPDYHRVALELLDRVCVRLAQVWPSESFVSFADNSPIREVLSLIHISLSKALRLSRAFHLCQPVYSGTFQTQIRFTC